LVEQFIAKATEADMQRLKTCIDDEEAARKAGDMRRAIRLSGEFHSLIAEVANHHPDIFIHDWNQVRITCTTHSEGGVTDADLALAKEIDELA
jgi:pterin-4a-carbinolamine dehydratase